MAVYIVMMAIAYTVVIHMTWLRNTIG